MEIRIDASDVRNFDEAVDRKFDISEEFGTGIFDDANRISLDNYNYHLEPHTYIGIIADMQQQLNELSKTVEQLKKKTGWVSGYDDNGWNISEEHE